MKTPMKRRKRKEHDPKILINDKSLHVSCLGVYGYIFFMLDVLPYVCMVRCGRPAVFMGLCKLRAIDDHVQCHATVVSSTNLLKADESWRLRVLQLYSIGEPVQCIHTNYCTL